MEKVKTIKMENGITRLIVSPSLYKELRKQGYNMKRYVKSKLIKTKGK